VTVTVNFCGEGEVRGAININLLDPRLLTRRLETVLAGGPCIQADVRSVPIRSGSVDRVVGNMLPYESQWMETVVDEAYRILVSDGVCALYASTGGGALVLPHLARSGFLDVQLVGPQATGRRP
jgi:hypothetical protein